MICYLLTNKTSNKKYVGITSCWLGKRVARHIKDAERASLTLLHRAIRKYGIENFSKEILVKAKNYQELREIEKNKIAELKTHYTEGGYNLTFGGDGGNTLLNPEVKKRHKENLDKTATIRNKKYLEWLENNSEEHQKRCRKMQKAIQAKWDDPIFREQQLDNNKGVFRKGHKETEKTRLKKSQARKGMKQSEAHKQNISKALKGRSFSPEHMGKLTETRKNKVTAYSLLTHKSLRVSKEEFDQDFNLVGIKSNKAKADMAISSEASQACEERSTTTWGDTNLSRNTGLAPDALSA